MLIWGLKPGLKSHPAIAAVCRLGVSLSVMGMLASNSAMAGPLFPSASPSAPGDAKATPSGDVVVEPTTTPDDSQPSAPNKPETKTEPTGGTATKANGPRFTCQSTNGQFLVMYHPESQTGQSYAWANPSTMGGGWTAERRCNEISRRLEFYRPDGLQEMRTAVENGYNIVCVTTQKVPGCRIVLTVPPGQDPIATRDRVFQNLTVADSGQQTEAVNTFIGGGRGEQILDELGKVVNINLPNLNLPGSGQSRVSGGIDLRPFLDRADGGTATHLYRGTSNRPAPRLNPDRFR